MVNELKALRVYVHPHDDYQQSLCHNIKKYIKHMVAIYFLMLTRFCGGVRKVSRHENGGIRDSFACAIFVTH